MYFLSGVRLAIQYNNPPKIAVNPLPVVARNIGLCTTPVIGLYTKSILTVNDITITPMCEFICIMTFHEVS